MPKKVLITGGAGFIGTALSCHLDREGYEVLKCDINKDSRRKIVRVDLLDGHALRFFLQKSRPQIIFHLAGGRLMDRNLMFAANVKTTITLFDAIGQLKGYHPRVVIMGSAAEYGDSEEKIITEKMAGPVEGAYGLIKRTQTDAALCYAGAGEDVVISRLFNIVGSGLPPSAAVGKFANDIVKAEKTAGRAVIETGNLCAVRDFLDIRDICDALCLLARHGRAGEIYNICSQKGMVMRDVLCQMLALSSKADLTFKEDRRRNAGVRYAVGSYAKLKKDTGWRPRHILRDGLSATLEYYRHLDNPFL